MKQFNIQQVIKVYSYDELPYDDRQLIDAAIEATANSYAPYSNFHVGAAARLDNQAIITGSNQENAAYPSGTCAERTLLFYANSRYPQNAIITLAIAARSAEKFTTKPVSPCGACRQVLLENEKRFHTPIRILLYSTTDIYEIEHSSALLPLQFSAESMDI